MKVFQMVIAVVGACLLSAAPFQPQNPRADFQLIGKVADQDTGQPVAGATVVFKGKQGRYKVATEADGSFLLSVADSCGKVEAFHAGYERLNLGQACTGSPLRLVLKARPVEIEEEADEAFSSPSPLSLEHSVQRAMASPKMMAPAGDAGLPMNTESYAYIRENRFLSPLQEPLSTFSIDVDAASYSNFRRFARLGQLPPKDAIRIEEMVNYFSYSYPQPEGEAPFSITTELGSCPWAEGHQLLHIGLQGRQLPREDLPPANLVFLLDVSGSMNAPNKLPLLKSSLKLLTDQLDEKDRVSIVVYAGAAGAVLAPTPGSNKQKILDALNSLQAGGSTAGGEGLRLAYQLAREEHREGYNSRVILATDGDFNVGESSDAAMARLVEEERESGVFLTVLGFGMGNYKDSKMQELAQKGNGHHAYIDDISEAKKVLVEEFGATVYAIASDVKLQLEFNPAQVQGYRLIGYESRLLQNEDFNDDQVDAGEIGAGHSVTALYEIIPAGLQTDWLADVDGLKYQEQSPLSGKPSKEWCTVKFRYKKPGEGKSQLLERVVDGPDRELSPDFKWSAAVAGAGMVLRGSKFKGNANLSAMLALARAGQGEDPNGYRAEFIRLIAGLEAVAAE